MTETIKLMKAHTSVRRFKEQEIPQEEFKYHSVCRIKWLLLGKISNPHSVIVVRSQEKNGCLIEFVPQVSDSPDLHAFLLFCR